MPARVFAFDPAAFAGATESIDVARQIVTGAPDHVVRAAGRVLACGSEDTVLVRATLFAEAADLLAYSMAAVRDVLNRLDEAAETTTALPLGAHGVGPIRLVLVRAERGPRAAAVLGAEQLDALSAEGLRLAPACSVLGVTPLPHSAAARRAVAEGETTLALACALLAAIPAWLLARAAEHRGASDGTEFGGRLYTSIFPGCAPAFGTALFWRDAMILAFRAVAGFDEWRATATAYQSAGGDLDECGRLLASVTPRVAAARAAL